MSFEQVIIQSLASIGFCSLFLLSSFTIFYLGVSYEDWATESTFVAWVFLISALPAIVTLVYLSEYWPEEIAVLSQERLDELEEIEERFEKSGQSFIGVEVGGEQK